jgi:hypothetical protein
MQNSCWERCGASHFELKSQDIADKHMEASIQEESLVSKIGIKLVTDWVHVSTKNVED